MTLLGPLGFTAPWLLLGLLALPVLWVILRAVPPAPIRRLFPGVVLLLGLRDEDQVTDRTPWWLLLLRMLAVAAVIVGLAGPVLNPEEDGQVAGSGPLLVVMDASWASARDWRAEQMALESLLARAERESRPVALLRLTAPEPVQFQQAAVLRARLTGLRPEPWQPDEPQIATALDLLPESGFDSYWMSDGLDRDSRAPLLAALEQRGDLTVFESPRSLYALHPARFEEGHVRLTARRLRAGPETEVQILGHGLDPAGNPAVLVRAPLTFAGDATEAELDLSLPAELRARITRFEVEGARSAGAVTLPDDSLRRREVALTDRECALLCHLVDHAGAVQSRGAIFDALWASDGSSAENVVDVYLGYLRRKLAPMEDFGFDIKTLRGRGFVLEGRAPGYGRLSIAT